MLKSLKLRYGILFLQGIVNDTGVYVFEAGYRPEGSNDFRFTEPMNGVNGIHLLIEQALTGTVEGNPCSKDNPRFPQCCCSFTLCAKGGKVAQVLGLEKISHMKEIQAIEHYYHEGDEIPFGGTNAQRMLRFFIISDSMDGIAAVINQIQGSVKVLDENGNSILFEDFDTNRLFEGN